MVNKSTDSIQLSEERPASPYRTRAAVAAQSGASIPSNAQSAKSQATTPAQQSAVSLPDPSGGLEIITDAEQEIATTPDDASIRTTYPPTQASTAASDRPLAPLPEPDRGKAAYLFLLSAFTVETVIWGVPSSYGVFLDFYQSNGIGRGKDASGQGLLPLVGTFSSGLMYLLGPFIAIMINPRPRWRLMAIRVGACIAVAGLLLSSFATTTWQLLLTQGLMYSVGGALVYYPTFSFLSEWFVTRRGFANGVCFAGTAAGGLVYPFLLDWMLSSYGAATCLQAMAIATALLLAISMPLLRPRIPVGRARSESLSKREHPHQSSSERRRVWRSPRLWIFMVANVAQAFGYFLPTLYLPTFASAIGLSGSEGSGMLACVNATAVISRITLGVLSDRRSPHTLGAVAMLASSLCVFILWGVTSTSFAPLLVFALVLGLAAGGWTSLYARIIKDTAKDDPQLATTLFGLVSFTRGLGSLLTAPISSYLLRHPLQGASSHTGFGVAHGQYGSLVVFAGLALAIAAGMEGIALI
ncbi:MFS general substrate transporter [Meredithblackwellia eburnea MCA 4105]